jgi:hypothetical protein
MKAPRVKNWFKKWLGIENEPLDDFPITNSGSMFINIDFDIVLNPIRLNLYRADGGIIVESKIYDSSNDSYRTKLHIISNDQDLGYELSKIITMENLRG